MGFKFFSSLLFSFKWIQHKLNLFIFGQIIENLVNINVEILIKPKIQLLGLNCRPSSIKT